MQIMKRTNYEAHICSTQIKKHTDMKHAGHEVCRSWSMQIMKDTYHAAHSSWSIQIMKHADHEACRSWSIQIMKHTDHEAHRSCTTAQPPLTSSNSCPQESMFFPYSWATNKLLTKSYRVWYKNHLLQWSRHYWTDPETIRKQVSTQKRRDVFIHGLMVWLCRKC
jgi:hypothetical protein